VSNTWVAEDNGNGIKFPRLDETTSTITDQGSGGPYSYSHTTQYFYDDYFNVITEKKGQIIGNQFVPDIQTLFSYDTNFLSKPTMMTVKNGSGSIASRKWMEYNQTTGNLKWEEVCKSDNPASGCNDRNPTQNPVINYTYYPNGNVNTVSNPNNAACLTTITYDPNTSTHVYDTTNCLGHRTTTVYDPSTGNLVILVPPHLEDSGQFFETTYDKFGRKILEERPTSIGGWTSYRYVLNDPEEKINYVEKIERIVEGVSPIEYWTTTFFDGMGRTYKGEVTGRMGN